MKFTISTIICIALAAAVDARMLYARQANLQTFDGNLGGAATPVVDSGDDVKPFSVNGATFVNLNAALQRSCDQQFNACANQANGGADFEVSDCQAQKSEFHIPRIFRCDVR